MRDESYSWRWKEVRISGFTDISFVGKKLSSKTFFSVDLTPLEVIGNNKIAEDLWTLISHLACIRLF
jgi:hypothetical protein